MKDEEVDLSEIPEVTVQDLRGAVLRLGGEPVPEGKSFVGNPSSQPGEGLIAGPSTETTA